MPRPRSFDLDDALVRATGVFLRDGFDGASLDSLTAAMGINRPSLYAAFGDKATLYGRALERYAAGACEAMAAALSEGDTLEESLRRLFRSATDVYAPRSGTGLGCLLATTATTAAGVDAEIRAVLQAHILRIDGIVAATLAARFRNEGGVGTIETVAELASATLFSLAIRARAGASRAQLGAIGRRAAAGIARAAAER